MASATNLLANPTPNSRVTPFEEEAARPSMLSIAIIRQFARAYRVERRMPGVFSGFVLN